MKAIVIVTVMVLALIGSTNAVDRRLNSLKKSVQPPAQQQGQQPAQQQGPSFNYGSHGEDWTGTCKEGQKQSPINIQLNNPPCWNPALNAVNNVLSFRYNPRANVTLERTAYNVRVQRSVSGDFGYAVQGMCDCGSSPTYVLQSFRFKSPSEHTIDGHNWPLELQLVHQRPGTTDPANRLIVAILFDVTHIPGRSNANAFLNDLDWRVSLSHLTQATQNVLISSHVDLNKLSYSLDGDFWAYEGSHTNPPCAEGVQWRVMKRFQGMSQKQFEAIQSLFPSGNNRKVQNINNRAVTAGVSTSCVPCQFQPQVPGQSCVVFM